MDSFNKIASFILGLVVVIVFFAVVTGKINLGKYTPSFAKKPTPTPTSISTVTVEENKTPTTLVNNTYKTTSSTTPKKIPSTGVETIFIPTLFASGLGGAFLRKTGKK
ncbi:MAG: hypothetical protein Fur009_0320 [Candidatus Microgenomates bacterium]